MLTWSRRPFKFSVRLTAEQREIFESLKKHWGCQGVTDTVERLVMFAQWELLVRPVQEAEKAKALPKKKPAKKGGGK